MHSCFSSLLNQNECMYLKNQSPRDQPSYYTGTEETKIYILKNVSNYINTPFIDSWRLAMSPYASWSQVHFVHTLPAWTMTAHQCYLSAELVTYWSDISYLDRSVSSDIAHLQVLKCILKFKR